ncbi:EAL domain-containing protein [Photobacterium sagamiensis]|uniref:EAL domain-containing protein n=1 Tax=Photobacterium sagamiensis TaxID=2910241 RepID=UPI003D0E74FE
MNFDSNIQFLRLNTKGVILNGFGHGNSTFAVLEQYDFDGIKINRLFNEIAGSQNRRKPLIKLIIDEYKSRGKLILGTMAYTKEEHEFFKYLGVDYFEGVFSMEE